MVNFDEQKRVLLASDLPDEFNGTVTSIEEGVTKEKGKSITFNITITAPKTHKLYVDGKLTETEIFGQETQVMYRLPKALTGKGQGDLLFKCMREMNLGGNTTNMINKEYVWKRIALRTINPTLPTTYNENPRHYPIRLTQTTL